MASQEWAEGYFKSWDGAELFCRFHDVAKPRHTLIILHGYGEHSGRYLKFSEKLKNIPVRLALFDYRGMGRSTGPQGEGCSAEEHLKDISAFVAHVRDRCRFKDKIILMGQSLGGLFAVEWSLAHTRDVKRLVLSAPFLGLRGLPLLRAFNAVIEFFMPKYVYRNPIIPASLTHDAAEVAAYCRDPLIKRRISAALIGSIMDQIVWLKRKETVTLPFAVNVLTAGKERVVDPSASRKFFNRLVAPKKELTNFDGFYHEIFNEEGQAQTFNVLKTILEECV